MPTDIIDDAVATRILTFAERIAFMRAVQNEFAEIIGDFNAPDIIARLDDLERRFDAYLEGVVTEGVN